MVILQNISYKHPNKELLFSEVNFSVNNREKVALIGNNGVGKSTLLRIIAQELQPSSGQVSVNAGLYYVPQIYGQFNHLTIGQALQIEEKLNALKEILDGNASEENFNLLQDDWTIENRCFEALNYWNLNDLDLSQKMEVLSGGQKTKVFLAGISIHQPELILLDEPSNHLDITSRQILYDFIQNTKSTLIVISHDRKLLNSMNRVCELSKNEIKTYGGNYDFYREQKEIETNALSQDLLSKEKDLRKAKEKERETLERQNKLDSRGKSKQEKAGVSRIMMNTLRNKAENSTSKLKSLHAEKIGGLSQELHELRSSLPDIDKIKFGFDNSTLHKGKIILKVSEINFGYDDNFLWKHNLDFELRSNDRVAIKGDNGSGKTTLINLILGKLQPSTGSIYRTYNNTIYIDQDYSLLDDQLKVYEQAQQFNTSGLQEFEVKIRLNRFLFTKNDWDKPCMNLSGGERMRLLLCCLNLNGKSPDIILLDEPTNNLDIQNVEILTTAINQYQGALIVISHDEMFLEQIHIERTIQL